MTVQHITDRITVLGRLAYLKNSVAGTLSAALDSWVAETGTTFGAIADADLDYAMDGFNGAAVLPAKTGPVGLASNVLQRAQAFVSSAYFLKGFGTQPASNSPFDVLTRFAVEINSAGKKLDTGGALVTFLNLIAGATISWPVGTAPQDYGDTAYIVN